MIVFILRILVAHGFGTKLRWKILMGLYESEVGMLRVGFYNSFGEAVSSV